MRTSALALDSDHLDRSAQKRLSPNLISIVCQSCSETIGPGFDNGGELHKSAQVR